ncbi:alpha/beta hydrolase [Rhodococcus qingshengii]|uniref:alpha/beta hydrolase n=1 Tax=Rhodococcus qingshengii TaxID=334542 RepID=UPI001F12942A|nr:dienelactone hydrolase family protein [Rhodococcus qingshengii]ULD45152.1 dienelactone hydrolase family protein [Rhodococcus qingshengii]
MDSNHVTGGNRHLQRPLHQYGHSNLSTARLAIYAVHGRGQQPEYMSAIADRIGIEGIAYVLPSAADNCWYPTRFTAPIENNQPSLDHTLDAVRAHLQWMADQGVGPGRTMLMGFSQGACVLAEYLLRTQHPYAAAAILTGGYIGPNEHTWPALQPGLSGMPTLFASATRDEFVPLDRVNATAESFVAAGASAELHVYDDSEHHVSDEVVTHLRALITRVTPGTNRPRNPLPKQQGEVT